MNGIENFYVFLLSSLILCLIPGVDMLFLLGKTFTSRGYFAPVICTFGITAGLVIHTCTVALGLGLLLARTPLAFHIIQAAGGAYLFYLGLGAMKAKTSLLTADSEIPSERKTNEKSEAKISVRSEFFQGLGVNLLNPKVVLFFLSYLPQFIAREVFDRTVPLLILGGIFCIIGTVWNLSLVFTGNFIRKQFLNHPKRVGRMNKIAGILFILLAIQIFAEILINVR